MHSDGRISGRVRDGSGRPVSGLTVEIVAASRLNDRFFYPRHAVRTAADGSFEATELPPGRYAMGFNTRSKLPYPRVLFSRDDADRTPRVVTLVASQETTVGDLTLPESVVVRSLDGVVRNTEGAPVQDAKVYLKAVGQAFSSSVCPPSPTATAGFRSHGSKSPGPTPCRICRATRRDCDVRHGRQTILRSDEITIDRATRAGRPGDPQVDRCSVATDIFADPAAQQRSHSHILGGETTGRRQSLGARRRDQILVVP